MNARSLTTALTALAALLCVGEFGSSIVIWHENYPDSQPAFAVVFALLFLLGVWLLRRARVTAGTVLVGVLCLFEVVSISGWTRHNAFDWVNQIAFAVVSLVALGVAVALVVVRRRSAPGAV
jgi:hypothetical protein